jgi:hypothetical protein
MTKTHQDFVKHAERIHGIGKYQYLSTYVNARTPLLMRCTICSNKWMQRPSSHLQASGCPQCARAAKKKTHEDFVKEANRIFGNGRYEYLSQYADALAPMLIKCTVCGTEWSQRPYDHLNGHGCRHCGYRKNSNARYLTLRDVVARARQIHGDTFEYPGPYIDAQSKMPIICPLHGIFYQRPAEHYCSPAGCPECAKGRRGLILSIASSDLSGKRFGKLVVTGRQGVKWCCLCECSKTIVASRKQLQKKKSCGFCRRGVDLTGRVVGRLTVIARQPTAQRGNGKCVKWIGQCTCGTEIVLDSHSLTKKHRPQRSCGCLQRDAARKSRFDFAGSEFGRLRVVKRHGSVEGKTWGGATWLCHCRCGRERDVIVTTNHLRMGAVKSCGCLSHSPCVLPTTTVDNLYVERFVDRGNDESFLKVGRTVNSTNRRYHGKKMYGHLDREPILVVTDTHDKIATLEYLITGRLPCQHASTQLKPSEFPKYRPKKLFDGSTECFVDAAIFNICEFINDCCPNEYCQRVDRDDFNDWRWRNAAGLPFEANTP